MLTRFFSRLFTGRRNERVTKVRRQKAQRNFLRFESLEERSLLTTVAGLQITSITSAADTDGNAGDEHVSVPVGTSAVSVNFKWTSAGGPVTAHVSIGTAGNAGFVPVSNPASITVNTAGLAVGTYDVQVQAKDGSPGNGSDSDLAAVVVATATITITPTVSVNAADADYTGSQYAGAVNTSVLDGATDVSADGMTTVNFYSDALATTEISAPTDAGTYYVKAHFASDGLNHGGTIYANADSSVTSFNINQVGSTVTVIDPDASSTITYDGNSHGTTASWASTGVDGGAGSLTVRYTGRNGTSYDSDDAPTNAGDYTASASFAGDLNHTGNAASADFTIAKASSTTSVTGGTFTYDGNAHGATGSSVTGAGGLSTTASAFSYYDSNNNLLPGAPVNAGAYTVVAHYAGDDNHNASDSTPATLTITKAVLTGEATTQAALNVAKNGTLAWTVKIDATSIVGGESVADLFNGATFKLTINGVAYSITSTASVVDGVIYVNWNVDAGLKDALDNFTTAANTSASTAAAGTLTVSATTNGGNYTFSDDFLTKLFYSKK